jgi:hypothetical protein
MAAVAATPAVAQPPAETATALETRVQSVPHPVLGADGRLHLAYEINVVNRSNLLVRLDSITALAGTSGGRVVARVRGSRLAAGVLINGGESGTTIFPSHSAIVFMDVTLPRTAKVPRALRHRFATTNLLRKSPKDDHRGVPIPKGSTTPRTITFVGAGTTVSTRTAIRIGAPLQGQGWLVGNGCCFPINAHRGTANTIDGTTYIAERFAIDFVRLDQAHRLFIGPVDLLTSYPYFGDPIHSVADGVVVRTQDGLPEATPGSMPPGATVQTAGGNYIVVRIAPGQYAFYAHLQPGSLRVKRGDRVSRGQIIGLLGNTGNTDAPHLHFHIMDGPSPLASDGLPFVFTSFTGQGVVTDLGPVFAGQMAPMNESALVGGHVNELPLDNQVITFPGG